MDKETSYPPLPSEIGYCSNLWIEHLIKGENDCTSENDDDCENPGHDH